MTIITLTFDDGLDSHLDVAIPTLDRFGLKGTFYVPAAHEVFTRRHAEWGAAARSGHELGNHTMFHPGVSTKGWVTEGIAIEKYSLDRMRRELIASSNVLSIVDGRTSRTFAFPCSNPWLGVPGWPRRVLTRLGLDRTRIMGWVDRFGFDWGSKLTDYTPEVRKLFVAARCGGIPPAQLPVVPGDRHRVRGVEADGLDAAELNVLVDTAIARDCWMVFVFHGVGGGHHLSCDTAAFESLAERLAGENRVSVLTFLDAAQRYWPESADA